MEIKATLNKPYTDTQRLNFIVLYNHQHGYEIKETETALEAWGKTAEEIAEEEKQSRKQELYDEADSLDLKSIRPLRAKEAGTATMEDLDRLAQYEARIAEIRQAIHDIDNPSETSEEFDIESEND